MGRPTEAASDGKMAKLGASPQTRLLTTKLLVVIKRRRLRGSSLVASVSGKASAAAITA